MTSTTINDYLNQYVGGKEKDHEIECSRNEYGVIKIIVSRPNTKKMD